MCHVSSVTCHVSRVMCHMSRITCHVSHVTIFFIFFLQSVEVYWWRFCYQRGLPRLVYEYQPLSLQQPSQYLLVNMSASK